MFNFGISITAPWGETFKLEGGHSFEEALKLVEKGIYDRKLEREKLGLWVGSPSGQAANLVQSSGPPPGYKQDKPDQPDMIKKVDGDGNQVGEIEHPNQKV